MFSTCCPPPLESSPGKYYTFLPFLQESITLFYLLCPPPLESSPESSPFQPVDVGPPPLESSPESFTLFYLLSSSKKRVAKSGILIKPASPLRNDTGTRNYRRLPKLIRAPSAFRMAAKGNEPMKPSRSDDLSYTLSRAVFRCEKGVAGLSIRNYKSELE
ncbi:hypothetical protein CEXT_213591 [Caerostris extrusa]|uniref:Uncharacterized protein n=1 Tax=Caerostris extrusa TaxID=172846 RepID=A0AAV4MC59_CAEEX|nr:hypothetical protein CEXT_213591 [Caerostris extrusa]